MGLRACKVHGKTHPRLQFVNDVQQEGELFLAKLQLAGRRLALRLQRANLARRLSGFVYSHAALTRLNSSLFILHHRRTENRVFASVRPAS